MKRYLLGLLLFSFAFLVVTKKAGAASYVFEKGNNKDFQSAQPIAKPQFQQYIYGSLGAGEDTVDYYSFDLADTTTHMSVEVMVTDSSDYLDFRPSLIFVDPRTSTMFGKTPFGFPSATGGRVYAWENIPLEKESDEAVLENFVVGPGFLKDLSANHYVVAVFDPIGKGGKYVIKLGAQPKDETIGDKFAAFWALIRIKFSLY